MSELSHTHDDDLRLTFGCPACLRRVAQDQRQAALDAAFETAELRTVTIKYQVDFPSVRGELTTEMMVPRGWDDQDLDEYLSASAKAEVQEIEDEIRADAADTLSGLDSDISSWEFDIGGVVHDNPKRSRRPMPGEVSLFA